MNPGSHFMNTAMFDAREAMAPGGMYDRYDKWSNNAIKNCNWIIFYEIQLKRWREYNDIHFNFHLYLQIRITWYHSKAKKIVVKFKSFKNSGQYFSCIVHLYRHRGRRGPGGGGGGVMMDERGPPPPPRGGVDPRHDPLTYIGPERQVPLPPSNLPIPVGIFMNMAHVPPR